MHAHMHFYVLSAMAAHTARCTYALQLIHAQPSHCHTFYTEACSLLQSLILAQVPAPGVPAPATTLASYIALPDLSTRQRATALTALAAMSEACAGMSNLSFAGCLPEGPGKSCPTPRAGLLAQQVQTVLIDACTAEHSLSAGVMWRICVSVAFATAEACITGMIVRSGCGHDADGKVDEDLRMQLVACFEPEVADGEPELLAAATKLAVSAIHHHPSLVDVLCFPTSLKLPAPDGKVPHDSSKLTRHCQCLADEHPLSTSSFSPSQQPFCLCIRVSIVPHRSDLTVIT